VRQFIAAAGGSGNEAQVIERLRDAAFLGVQTAPNRFVFSDDPRVKRRTDIISDRLREQGNPRCLRVNRALWAFLEIAEQESLLGSS
jgi:UDP-N-acetylmuramyl tripeptide synthase